ncbi:MSP domain containing protein [Lasiodiplodia theobromae]|uniref:MSP domain containing protein n=1 Tax=Lasiodiplodia theobromae TaxID=45133 RepID=UPI0015C3E00C|nr:MSP domain containing protein [Lasiodiplodia theobromae]KAF4538879.1 MSP domain containing protein [Lasiodiplodia theobromae]
MSVELTPPELGFKRPFTQEVSQSLRLRNPNSDPVAFKVKTTAPKQYCVRPNSGRIEAGKEVEVQVLLQAMKEDPPPDARCRDKFLVQSVAVTADMEFSNVGTIWSHIEQTAKHTIQEKKIRVVFLPADSTSGAPSVNGTTANDVSSQRSPSPEAVTPQRTTTGSVSRPESRPSSAKTTGEAVNSAFNPANQSMIGSAVSSVTSAIPTSTEELKAQLQEARATIARLEQQASQGLRQRKGEGVSSKEEKASNLAVQQAPAGGVPVQVVAGLCLFSFLLAYFFF